MSAITLAVSDVARSLRFYQSLGWAAAFVQEDIAFLQANGLVLSLWNAHHFAAETRLPTQPGGFALAHNLGSADAVDALLVAARDLGAHVLPATPREWGGHSGHFADPDGHLWEVAWNPFWDLERDNTRIPPTPTQAALEFLTHAAAGSIDKVRPLLAPNGRHHNPHFAAGWEPLLAALAANAAQFPEKRFEVQRALHEGDTVAVHSRVILQPTAAPVAVVHLFRFEGSRIAELWDVAAPVPENVRNRDGVF